MNEDLRLTGLKLGCLLNVGEALRRDGITRTINGDFDSHPPCLGASVREESNNAVEANLTCGGARGASPLMLASRLTAYSNASTFLDEA